MSVGEVFTFDLYLFGFVVTMIWDITGRAVSRTSSIPV